MGNIVWLASFPKSGNTWLRLFLANYLINPKEPFPINKAHMVTFGDMMAEPYAKLARLPVTMLDDAAINGLRPRVHRAMAGQKADILLVKTHQAVTEVDGVSTVTFDATKAAIYVIRNPLDVAVSYAHHYGRRPAEIVEALDSPAHRLPGDRKHLVTQYLGRWSDHVLSWVDNKTLAPLVLRYEDLTRRPQEEFAKTVSHLGMDPDPERLERAVAFSSFDELSRQEGKSGFIERSKSAERFFRGGRIGDGLKSFSEAEIARIIDDQREVMTRFGYLDAAGKLVL